MICEQTPTYLHFEHLFHDTRRWFGWENVRTRIRKREISNLLAPVVGDLTIRPVAAG